MATPRGVPFGYLPADRTHTNTGRKITGRDSLGRVMTQKPNPDPTRNIPTNWQPKYQLLLYMDVAGQSGKYIAEQLGYTVNRVYKIQASPLYQAQKKQLLENLAGVSLSGFLDKIRADAPKNFEALVELRDDQTRNLGDPKIQVAAARAIQHDQDRVFPRKTEHTEERTIRLILDGPALSKIAQGLAEARGIDAIEADFDEIPPSDPAQLMNPQAIEELASELTQTAESQS